MRRAHRVAGTALLGGLVCAAGAATEGTMASDLATRLAAVRDQSTCRITTTGRRSGKPHTVTIWFVAEGTTIYLGTLSAKRDWVRNVARTPAVELAMDGLRVRGRAVAATDPAEVQKINGLIAGKYWMAWIGSWFGRGADRVLRVDGLEILQG